MTPDGADVVPPPPPAATTLFGDRLPLAQAYARLLATDGVDHGHLGPREVSRIWDRHLVNSALLAGLIPVGPERIVDVGSGAGLPGLPIAIARPDLAVVLLEPMARRIRFLEATVAELGLDHVEVVRGRAGDGAGTARHGGYGYVVARAVAPLDRLVGWCLPLLRAGGELLALKGDRAEAELAELGEQLAPLGAVSAEVVSLGAADVQARVVRIVRGDDGVVRSVPGRSSRQAAERRRT